ncbi:MAG TPA: permease [Egibacteraceae bacterium]|nr:permease [Egibacteraceae bacterium]
MSADAASKSLSEQPGVPRAFPALELLAVVLVAAVIARPHSTWLFDSPALQMWSTLFVSITVQALPFLVLGVVVSGAVSSVVPAGWLAAHLPRRPALAVGAAGLAGVALPGCECGSVPIAGRLTTRGLSHAAAFTFMLAAPAINPVVLVSTAVAFPGRPMMVLARFGASLSTAIAVGLLWERFGRASWVDSSRLRVSEGATRWESFADTARHDFLHAGGWLVVGAMVAATLQVIVPQSVIDTVTGTEWLAILALALLAVAIAICSEADAFVAAGLTQFSMTSRLVFLVVGPAVDIKLIALQAGVFGRRFAVRFAPTAFAVAVGAGVLFGRLLE